MKKIFLRIVAAIILLATFASCSAGSFDGDESLNTDFSESVLETESKKSTAK